SARELKAARSMRRDASSRGQWRRMSDGLIPLLVGFALPLNRSCWIRRARLTRSRIDAERSPGFVEVRVLKSTRDTSTWMSMRSNKGPDILDRYRCTWRGVHVQGRSSSHPKKPQGQGFIEPTSMNSAG